MPNFSIAGVDTTVVAAGRHQQDRLADVPGIGRARRTASSGAARHRPRRWWASRGRARAPPPAPRHCAQSAPGSEVSTLPRKSLVAAIMASPPGTIGPAAPEQPHEARERPRHAEHARPRRQRDHRRRQHDALEPAAAVVAGADGDRPAHGMAEAEDRRRAVRQHHLLHEGRRGRCRIARNCAHGPCGGPRARGRTGPARASRRSPPQSRARAGRARSRNISR